MLLMISCELLLAFIVTCLWQIVRMTEDNNFPRWFLNMNSICIIIVDKKQML